ncbi:hypothetical protein PIB30_074458 [Stylosanthes scabra]|uniref:TF-B3 domain-containing protein n=1 Tax=Stylosanthes scabra TaxID=79078 RepID=A0ABU6SRK7_9FABA|nr:hypothetical protein [Stylosanthes scabra]
MRATPPIFYSTVKVLTRFQTKNYALLIPARFALRAFPSKRTVVTVVHARGLPIDMKLRWRGSNSNEVFLTGGWKAFAAMYKLRNGSVLKFNVSSVDESIMSITIINH